MINKIVIIVILILSIGNVCHANKTFKSSKDIVVINMWNDYDDYERVNRLQKCVVNLISLNLKQRITLDNMEKRFQALSSINSMLLSSLEITIDEQKFNKLNILQIMIGILIINITFMFLILLYIKYRRISE